MSLNRNRPATIAVLAVMTSFLALTEPIASREPLHVSYQAPLDGSQYFAFDARWDEQDHALLAAPDVGVLRVPLTDRLTKFEVIIPSARSPQALPTLLEFPMMLGVSQGTVLAGSTGRALGWAPLNTPTALKKFPIESTVDLDIHDGRILTLGVQRGPNQEFAPYGVIARIGSAAAELKDQKPVLISEDGPGVNRMNHCNVLKLGGARFLRNGSFLIVPGSEPGILLYNSAGVLTRTWEDTKVGLNASCAMGDKESITIAASGTKQLAQVNDWRVLEEILPLPEGPALLVREVRQGVVHWDLAHLKENGDVVLEALPFTSAWTAARLRGDVDDNGRILLLMQDLHTGNRDNPDAKLMVLERKKAPARK